MVTPATAAIPTLKDALWERYTRLLDIKRRIYAMRAYVDELTRVTRGKPFQIRNDIVYNMVLDYRDKCVIDLFSFTVEMRHGIEPADGSGVSRKFMRKTGLFKLIRDEYLTSFSRAYVPHPSDDEYEAAIYTKANAEKFMLLFQFAMGNSPTAMDVDALCEECRVYAKPLGDDRNKNRAHAYEGEAGTAKMHSVDELEAYFQAFEDLLEGLSLLSANAGYGGGNMNRTSVTDTAIDLVDLILFGHADDVARLLKKRTREALYARLHEIDDAHTPTTGASATERLYFNQRQFEPEFYNDDAS